MSPGEKFLVVGPSWVGDMVMAHSLYRLLASRGAGRIDVVAPPWSLPLLARMPEVGSAIELDVGHGELGWSKRRALARRLAAESYDRAIVLPRSLKAALVPYFAGIPVRTGFRGEWRYGLINDMRPFDPARLDKTVLRFLALGVDADERDLPAVPLPRLSVDAAARAALQERLGLSAERPVVALMPGAEYGEAKRWPVDYFAELASGLTEAGFAVWVLGSAKERDLGQRIEHALRAPAVTNLCGRTSLADVVDLLAAAAVAVTNDSGLMHVAAAAGAHVVAVYGSSSPDFTPPLTEAKTICYRGLDCSPCFRRRCPLRHLNCLRGIEPAEVLDAALTAARQRLTAHATAPT